jgi:hypothetical protein
MVITRVKKSERRLPVSVSFGVTSVTKKLTELSTLLGIKPTHAFELGDEFQTRTGTHKRERSVWQLRSDSEVASNDIQEHFSWLLEKLEPHHIVISTCVDDPEMEVAFRIDCRCPDCIGGTSVPSHIMQRLATLSNRIDIAFIGEPYEGGEDS